VETTTPKNILWLMFPTSDVFARVPFHVTHTILEKGMLKNRAPQKSVHLNLLVMYRFIIYNGASIYS
jgi:hypothetical protein